MFASMAANFVGTEEHKGVRKEIEEGESGGKNVVRQGNNRMAKVLSTHDGVSTIKPTKDTRRGFVANST